MTDDPDGRRSKKRVRFGEGTTVELANPDPNAAAGAPRRTILPGGAHGGDARARRSDIEAQEPEAGPVRAMDPTLAATRRALTRRVEALSAMTALEDTSLPDDLAAAEADYDEPEEMYNEVGIPIEPFHLRSEREAGYFDAEGNYLEYRLDAEDTDAWLESMMDEHRQVRADPELLARRRAAAAAAAAAGTGPSSSAAAAAGGAAGVAGSAGAARRRRAAAAAAAAAAASKGVDAGNKRDEKEDIEDDNGDDADADDDDDDDEPYELHLLDDTGAELGDEERALLQKRIADLLQSGETPLVGLRRLGRRMHEAEAAAKAEAEGAREGEEAGKEGKKERKKGEEEEKAQEEHAEQAQGVATAAGEAAVGAAAGVPLSSGERQRLRKARRAAQQPPPQPPQQQAQQGKDAVAMEMDGEREGQAAAPAAGEGEKAKEGAEARPGDAPPSPAARQSVAEAAAGVAARRHPPTQLSAVAIEARRQFDALTSASNLLLSAGQFEVYSSTREQLLRAAQRTLGVDVVRSLALPGAPRPVPAAPVPGAAGGKGGGSKGPESAAGTGAEVAAAAGAVNAAAAARPSGPVAAVDDDVDMFGDDDEHKAAGASQPGMSSSATAVAATAAAAAAAAATAAGTAAVATQTAPPAPPAGLPPGYDLDPSTGYYYNSDVGFYWDPATCLYGDASTGAWHVSIEAARGSAGSAAAAAAVGEGREKTAGGAEAVQAEVGVAAGDGAGKQG
ncbi:hypothetical protein CHLRE_06g299450v5 [Chlamydomonas reinhardtii]|uniref:OCRE domain-containing protein n=1 Tax=Chlamydomonas reinhardtii TaxID=3055 RepID=A0A2K3DQV0_CHLRE|nr:uncharacterized protein CHLRE_06g299450v5 [Chlamydomonas reinhardtii]PNW82914.1 hypothetical protein CHLRE_06g299450v5 [Chlamydomonas reinhardtii]